MGLLYRPNVKLTSAKIISPSFQATRAAHNYTSLSNRRPRFGVWLSDRLNALTNYVN
ncbi:hypothetical protein ACX8XN_08240 [Calditrichota bacterium GD2]